MVETRLIMGMPITLSVPNSEATPAIFDRLFAFFSYVDEQYSPYKPTSQVSLLNAGVPLDELSPQLREILSLCEQTKRETVGYFDISNGSTIDPSGLVKGWAVHEAATLLQSLGIENFSVDAGGDIQVAGQPQPGRSWQIGIRNPFAPSEIIKVVSLSSQGIATSGCYIRGQHIYNPHEMGKVLRETASLSVIGPNIYEADRFATAAFAMGPSGIAFIDSLDGFEGYSVDESRTATMTQGFHHYVTTEAAV
jgi:thiamine biosynthesis lipoprotein